MSSNFRVRAQGVKGPVQNRMAAERGPNDVPSLSEIDSMYFNGEINKSEALRMSLDVANGNPVVIKAVCNAFTSD